MKFPESSYTWSFWYAPLHLHLLHGNVLHLLTHWGRVTHICVGNLTIIGPDNGLSPGRRQAITWTNAGILFIGPRGTNFSEILIDIHTFSFKKIHLKISSAKWRPFCLGLNVLMGSQTSPGFLPLWHVQHCPDSTVHGANMGPIWDRQDPGGPHVGHINCAIWMVARSVQLWEYYSVKCNDCVTFLWGIG